MIAVACRSMPSVGPSTPSTEPTYRLGVSFVGALILNLHPSGNPLELRCQAEVQDSAQAEAMTRDVLARATARLA